MDVFEANELGALLDVVARVSKGELVDESQASGELDQILEGLGTLMGVCVDLIFFVGGC